MYTKTLFAGWADMDFNSLLAGTAYLNKCSDARVMFFAENGFSTGGFARLAIGAVAMRDKPEYFREVGLLQEIKVTAVVAGLSIDEPLAVTWA